MIRFLPILFIIQGFCVWHAFSNRAEARWFWIISLLPGLGSIIYLYHHFYNKEHIGVISETVKGAVNSNYRTEQLENELEFSDSILNRSNLWDAYSDSGRYEEAIELYKSCLIDFNSENVDLIKKLVHCYFQLSNFIEVVKFGSRIEDQKGFKYATERIEYAWGLYELNELKNAEKNFKGMDSRYSNYSHRTEFAKFLEVTDRKPEAIEMLEDLLNELDKMNSGELRPWRDDRRSIGLLLAEYKKN
jgi:hypothetical protein